MYCIAEGVSIMKRIKALNLNFKGVFMTVSPSRPFWEEYLDIDGDLVITPSQWHPDIQSPCSVFGDAQNYGLEYEKRFGVPASYDVASRSAAGLMLQHAIQVAVFPSPQRRLIPYSQLCPLWPNSCDGTGCRHSTPLRT